MNEKKSQDRTSAFIFPVVVSKDLNIFDDAWLFEGFEGLRIKFVRIYIEFKADFVVLVFQFSILIKDDSIVRIWLEDGRRFAVETLKHAVKGEINVKDYSLDLFQ